MSARTACAAAIALAAATLCGCGASLGLTAQYQPMGGGANDGVGIGMYGFYESSLGCYLDIRFTPDDRSPMEDSALAGDTLRRTQRDIGGANVGVTYLLAHGADWRRWGVAAFAGVGYAELIDLEKYESPRGYSFWVEEDREGGANLNLGLAAWFGHAMVTLGYDTFLEAPAFGIGYRL